MKKLFIVFVLLISATLTGCAGITPPQGAFIGAAIGQAVRSNTRNTLIGAAVGGLTASAFGQTSFGHQQSQCQVPYGLTPICHTGRLVCENNQLLCDLRAGQVVQGNGGVFISNTSRVPLYIPPGAVCGPASMSMSCPSVAVSGTNCRVCQ